MFTNKHENIIPVVTALTLIILSGCLDESISKKSEVENDWLLKIEYDEQTVSLANYQGKQNNTKRGKANIDYPELLDYQLVHSVELIDDLGYYSWKLSNIEGNQSIRMPLEIWNDTKSIRPAKSNSDNPINKVVADDGMILTFGINGEIVSETYYNPEDFRISPDSINMIRNSIKTGKKSLNKKRKAGIDIIPVNDNPVMNRIENIIDKETGKVLKSTLFDSENRIVSKTINKIEFDKPIPIISNQIIHNYGLIDNDWGKIHTTYINRSNINVQFK